MHRTLRRSLSSGTALLLLAACGPHVPTPARVAPSVEAFGALDGPDSLLVLPEGFGARPRPPFVPPRVPALVNATFASVTLALVIDTSGRAVLPSVAVLQAQSEAYVRALCATLPRQLFVPAMQDGRPRRALTLMTSVTHRVGDETPDPNWNAADSAMRAMPAADLVRFLATKPGCP